MQLPVLCHYTVYLEYIFSMLLHNGLQLCLWSIVNLGNPCFAYFLWLDSYSGCEKLRRRGTGSKHTLQEKAKEN